MRVLQWSKLSSPYFRHFISLFSDANKFRVPIELHEHYKIPEIDKWSVGEAGYLERWYGELLLGSVTHLPSSDRKNDR